MQIIKFVTLINSLRVIKIIKQLPLIIFISQLFKKVLDSKILLFYFLRSTIFKRRYNFNIKNIFRMTFSF